MSAKSKAKSIRPATRPAAPARPPTTEEMKDVVRAWLDHHHPGTRDAEVSTYSDSGSSEITVKIIDPYHPDPMAALVAGARAVMRHYPGARDAALVVTHGTRHLSTIQIDPGPAAAAHDPLGLVASGAWAVMKATPRADSAALIVDFGPNKESALVPIFPEGERPTSLDHLPKPFKVPPFTPGKGKGRKSA